MMININKFINSFPKSSKNIFDDLIIPLNKRTGFINGKSPIVPIYFYRLIGIFNNETDYYTNIKNLNNSLILLKDSYLTFSSTISDKNNPQLTNIFQWMWDNYKIQEFHFKNTRTLIKIFKENKLLPLLNNALLNSSLEESLNLILELYIKKRT
ncbi:YceG family protein [Clostridium haemolyticum]|uniref:YceG family protein n=1 Tax=Clostridium haemolyticum TaxID=84025 RepID=UPI0023DDF753|nr:YceG family protein [Clostridium haemolyticum]